MKRVCFVLALAVLLWALDLAVVWWRYDVTTMEGACYVYFEWMYGEDTEKARRRADAMYARSRRELLSYYLGWLPASEAWRRVALRSGPELEADVICHQWLRKIEFAYSG